MEKLCRTAKILDVIAIILFLMCVVVFVASIVSLVINAESGINISLLLTDVLIVFLCYGIKSVRNILKPMKKGSPFDTAVSVNLKKLGFVSIAGGIIANAIELIGYHNMAKDYAEVSLMVYKFDVTFLVIAMVLFLLSYIFRYGEELQKQSDETL